MEMSGSRNPELQALTLNSSVLVLLRALYTMVLDYCILKEHGGVVAFTKDQLISLIERSSPDIAVGDIPGLAARGLFKPASIPGPQRLQVLVVSESGAHVLPAEEALALNDPLFPNWWEAPVPLALSAGGKLHFNPTALLMFSSDLKKMNARDLPDKNEFMVELEGRETPCVCFFRRLEENVFLLEDCTDDIAAAEEISWWAAVGKAWTEKLEQEKRNYRRCGEAELNSLRADCEVWPCEWEGELVGYFCVEKTAKKTPRSAASPKGENKKNKTSGRVAKEKSNRASSSSSSPSAGPESRRKEKNESAALTLLNPQTLGLLAPEGSFTPDFAPFEGESGRKAEKESPAPKKGLPRKAESKGKKGEKTKKNA